MIAYPNTIADKCGICLQIIVVVTDDGVVHCFTDQLEQLWMSVVFKDGKELQSVYFR